MCIEMLKYMLARITDNFDYLTPILHWKTNRNKISNNNYSGTSLNNEVGYNKILL